MRIDTSLKLLRAKEAHKLLGISRSKFYDLIKKGELPSGIKLYSNIVLWEAQEIDLVIRAYMVNSSQEEMIRLSSVIEEKRLNSVLNLAA